MADALKFQPCFFLCGCFGCLGATLSVQRLLAAPPVSDCPIRTTGALGSTNQLQGMIAIVSLVLEFGIAH